MISTLRLTARSCCGEVGASWRSRDNADDEQQEEEEAESTEEEEEDGVTMRLLPARAHAPHGRSLCSVR